MMMISIILLLHGIAKLNIIIEAIHLHTSILFDRIVQIH